MRITGGMTPNFFRVIRSKKIMQNKSQELQVADVSSFANDALIFAGGFSTLLFVIGFGLHNWGII